MKKPSEVAIFTDKVAEVSAFYERVLGAAPVYKNDMMSLFQDGSVTVLIHQKMPAEAEQPPNEDHFAFKAANVDEACAELAQQGIQMLLEPRDYDWGRSAYLRDPDGRLVEIH